MVLKAVDVGANAAARFLAAELVGERNVDRCGHPVQVDAVQELFKRDTSIMLPMMRWLLALLSLMVAAPAAAQTYAPPAWNPAADYVTPGQDEPGYRAWVAREPVAAGLCQSVQQLSRDLWRGRGGADLAIAAHRERLAEMRRPAFEVPPTSAWPNIVAALRYVGAYVDPAHRAGRGGFGLSQRRAQRLRARRADQHASPYGRGRHGAVAPDQPRGVDEPALRHPSRERRRPTRPASVSTRGCASTSTHANIANGERWGPGAATVAARCWPRARRHSAYAPRRPPVIAVTPAATDPLAPQH